MKTTMDSKLTTPKQHGDMDLIKIYRLPLDTQIMLVFLGIVFALVGFGLFGFALFLGTGMAMAGWIVLPALGLMMLIFSFWMAVIAIFSTTTLYRDRIVQNGLFTKNELRLQDIRGYKRLTGKAQGLELRPNTSRLKLIQVSLPDAKSSEFVSWLKDIPSLDGLALIDKDDAAVDLEIAQDTKLGATVEDRKAKVAFTRIKANIFTGGYFVTVFVMSFLPDLAGLFMTLFVLMPWFAIFLIARYPADYTILDRDKKALLRKADLSFLAIGSVILFTVMVRWLDINQAFRFPIHWMTLLLTSFVVGLLMLMLVRSLQSLTKPEILMSVGLWAAFSVYAVHSLVMLNSYFDRSVPVTHVSEVRQLTESKGKRTSYRLSIAKADSSYDGETNFTLPFELYKGLRLNGKVCVLTHSGALSMAWQSIKACHAEEPPLKSKN